MRVAVVVAALHIAVTLVAAQGVPVTVTIDSGPVTGVSDASINARYFKGIPFAATTGGVNRWLPPQPVAPWTTPFDASAFGPGCLQTHHNPDVPTVQSEDCLNVNVYTPLNAAAGADLPVMVFLHGGAFLEGSNQGPFGIYDGSYMAQSGNVVVVTSNYRLGVLGCLVTDTLNGNFALMDQRAALQWVQRNAHVFGGNSSRVTLFGESAGAMSVGLHVVSPLSKGLFQRVIMESNPIGLLYKTLPQANLYGQYFCQLLNCQIDAHHCNETCIRNAPQDPLLKAWEKSGDNVWIYVESEYQHLLDGFLEYTPVVDGVQVPVEPLVAFANGAYDKSVQMIVGSNRNEAVTFVYGSLPEPLPYIAYELGMEFIYGVDNGKAIVERYYNASVTDGIVPVCEVLTDYMFACSSEAMANAVATTGTGAVWEYRYDHVFSDGWLFPKFGMPKECANVTCHAAELPFVFHNEVHTAQLNVSFTPAEKLLSQSFVDYWTSFAHSGDPNSGGTQMFWPKYDPTNRQTLLIDEQMTVASTAPLCEFWDKIGYNH